MVRGFGMLNHVHRTINNPRGYLIRIAMNLWVDAILRRSSASRRKSHLSFNFSEPGISAQFLPHVVVAILLARIICK